MYRKCIQEFCNVKANLGQFTKGINDRKMLEFEPLMVENVLELIKAQPQLKPSFVYISHSQEVSNANSKSE